MTALGEGSDPGVHIICDHRALRKYGLGFVKPFPVPYGGQLRSGQLEVRFGQRLGNDQVSKHRGKQIAVCRRT
jgi:hypothetical protein